MTVAIRALGIAIVREAAAADTTTHALTARGVHIVLAIVVFVTKIADYCMVQLTRAELKHM